MSAFPFVDPLYHEPIGRYAHSPEFERVLTDVLPESWSVERSGVWMAARPPWRRYPDQGFKLHVSAVPDDAEEILRRVAMICGETATEFKCAADPRLLGHINSKRASRGSSGKFMTLYPESDHAFEGLAARLAEATAEFDGPYILSDRRVPGSRCVFYRYGGFSRRSRMRPDGTREYLIRGVDGSDLPDRRQPFFALPEGIADPFPPEDAASGGDLRIGDRFEIREALAFSNTGGVYLATDLATGADAVLKEARPHTSSWSMQDGYLDAVGMLEHEHAVLTDLAGTGVTVQPLGMHRAWEHTFLAQSFAPGEPLRSFRGRPEIILTTHMDDPERVGQFCGVFHTVARGLLAAVRAVHEAGYVIGDLSPNNIMVDADTLGVTLIDVESAHRPDDRVATLARGWYTPGFRPLDEAGRRAVTPADDLYAAGMALYSLVMPVQHFFRLHPEAGPRFIDRFVAAGLPEEVRDVIAALARGDAEAAEALLDAWTPTLSVPSYA